MCCKILQPVTRDILKGNVSRLSGTMVKERRWNGAFEVNTSWPLRMLTLRSPGVHHSCQIWAKRTTCYPQDTVVSSLALVVELTLLLLHTIKRRPSDFKSKYTNEPSLCKNEENINKIFLHKIILFCTMLPRTSENRDGLELRYFWTLHLNERSVDTIY